MKAWRKAAAGRTAKAQCLRAIKASPWWSERIKYLAKVEGWVFAWNVCQMHGLHIKPDPSEEELKEFRECGYDC